jgi:transcriptional regulator with XRE-family HTH domain
MFSNNTNTEMDNEQLESAVDQHVGQRLKHRRIVLGLTRQDVGDAVKVSVQQIHKYETAINRVSSSKLYNLARFLKVPVNYFFEMLESTVPNSNSTEEIAKFDTENLSEREVVKLMQVYQKIKPHSLRRKILDLIDALGDSEDLDIKKETKE